MNILEGIKHRRSINFFDSSKKIDKNTLEELINTANLAPSSFNLQPWELIVVSSKENKEKLQKLAFNQEKVSQASASLIVVANPKAVEENVDKVLETMVKLGYITQDKVDFYKKMPFNLYSDWSTETRRLFAVKNTSFFAMNLMTVATGLGLETHPMDGINEEGIKKEFNIKEHKIVPYIIALGYPSKDLKLLPRGYRRNIQDFVKFI